MENLKRYLWQSAKVILSCSLLYYFLRDIELKLIFDNIARSNIYFLSIAYALGLLVPLFNSLRIKIFTDQHGMNISLNRILNISLASLFYSLLIPTSLTVSAVRLYRLARFENKFIEILSSLTYLKVMSLFVIFTIAIVFFNKQILGNYYKFTALAIAVSYVFILFILFTLYANKGSFILDKLYKFVIRLPLPSMARKFISKLDNSSQLISSLSWSKIINLFLLTTMVYFSGFISFYFLTRALDIYVDFKNLISIRSLSLIITSIPISIGGFGLREGSFLILFESFGIDSTRIISLSFLLFSRTLFLGIIGGILEFVNIITPDDNKI